MFSAVTYKNCDTCAVGGCNAYAPTYADNRKLISESRLSVREFDARQVIVAGGKPMASLMTVRDGWACKYQLLPDGRRHILSFLIPGDTILFEILILPSFVPNYSVMALTPVTACLFETNEYRRIVTSSPSQMAKFETIAQRFCTAIQRRQVDLGRRSAAARVANLLLEIEVRLRDRHLVDADGFFIPLGQRDISDATGVTTAHVNRVLGQFREAGLLRMGKKRLLICDRDRLREIGESE